MERRRRKTRQRLDSARAAAVTVGKYPERRRRQQLQQRPPEQESWFRKEFPICFYHLKGFGSRKTLCRYGTKCFNLHIDREVFTSSYARKTAGLERQLLHLQREVKMAEFRVHKPDEEAADGSQPGGTQGEKPSGSDGR